MAKRKSKKRSAPASNGKFSFAEQKSKFIKKVSSYSKSERQVMELQKKLDAAKKKKAAEKKKAEALFQRKVKSI